MNQSTSLNQLRSIIASLSEDRQQSLLRLLKSGDWHPRGIREHGRKNLVLSDPESREEIPFAIRDISIGGAFIKTENPLSLGQELSLDITFSNSLETFTIPGRVIRITGTGVGIEFTSLDGALRNILKRMLAGRSASGEVGGEHV